MLETVRYVAHSGIDGIKLGYDLGNDMGKRGLNRIDPLYDDILIRTRRVVQNITKRHPAEFFSQSPPDLRQYAEGRPM